MDIDFRTLNSKDKIKLGIALGGVVLVLISLYWFVLRKPAPEDSFKNQVVGSTPEVPEANTRMRELPAGGE